MLQLRGYQERSLEALESYLKLVLQHGARDAFKLLTTHEYLPVDQLPGLPYVCLRVPTGGGKTLMACHALGIAVSVYLQADRAVCLWLVPSKTIRDQTISALRDRQHPYRQAIDARVGGQVRVMDLLEALYVQQNTLAGDTVIIVSTIQALRVGDTDGRKIYEASGALQHHFGALPEESRARLEAREDGSPIPSLANVLRLWRPLVIVDEAHNARTPLSFDTLARFTPSCIIEFTATPQTVHRPNEELYASNVLHHVSALELKAEEMVKLPIKLRTRPEWKEVVSDALAMQRELERLAKREEGETGDYLRPIVLFQAQPRSQDRPTLTVEVVKKCLMEDFKVQESEIAVATGETRELDDVDLFDRTCPIRFIITVLALKEGWDCPFAYALCSVAEMGATRAVEQILGRVMRLPGARRKRSPELNCAYAFAASQRFIEAANSLCDALVENGFEKWESKDLVIAQEEAALPFPEGPLFARASQTVSEKPDLSRLDESIRAKVSYDESTGRLTLAAPITPEEVTVLENLFVMPENRAAVAKLVEMTSPVTAGKVNAEQERPPFKVPWLAIRVNGDLEVFEESHLSDVDWNLAQCDATLSETEFPSEQPAGEAGVVDISDAGKAQYRFVSELHEQLELLAPEPGWTVSSLVNWLDRHIAHLHSTQAQSSVFIHNAVTRLMETRGLTVEQPAHQKFRLRSALESKIEEHRLGSARLAHQALLFGPKSATIEVRPDFHFEFDESRYSPNWNYQGSFVFQKHYFRFVGELESKGEQFECATLLDSHPQVRYWVRNLERRAESSFWLQTSTDKFYPDFVALLQDGRILVVEYKGEIYWSNDDSKEKRAVGELWAERSGGSCLFVMPKGKDWSAIEALLQPPARPPATLF